MGTLVDDINDLKLAPFHILPAEGKVHVDKAHDGHMETIRQVSTALANLTERYQLSFVDWCRRLRFIRTPKVLRLIFSSNARSRDSRCTEQNSIEDILK